MNKKQRLTYLTLFTALVMFSGCSKAPSPIQYGSDQCSFCKMNIVDKAHAAQYVSDKGKQFKYDAIECLIREVVRNDIQEFSHILVANYSEPGSMIDANKAVYIISENIQSPMGANLSAVSTETTAIRILEENGGQKYGWVEIKSVIEPREQ